MKKLTCLSAALMLLAAVYLPAQAAQYPQKLVTVVVPSAAGSAPDIISRLLADRLGAAWNERFIVENRPGGNGIVAMHAMNRAKPDGYTLGVFHAASAVTTPYIYEAADFDIDRDSEVIATIAYTPMMLVTAHKDKFPSLAELVKIGKMPGNDDVVIGSPTRGSVPNLTIEMLQQLTGAKYRQVSFSGTSQAITAAVSGDLSVYIDGVAPLVPLVKAGRLTALAVTAPEKLPGFEDIPLAKDTVPGFLSTGWFALFAPKGTSPEILDSLNAKVRNVLAEPAAIERLKGLGTYPMVLSREDSRKFVSNEKNRWEKVITKAGLNVRNKSAAAPN